jgi:3-ketosteroid 9alpha-monooxygenase subunit A
MLDYRVVDQEWRFLTGWPDARSDDPDAMALRIHSHLFGLGGAISVFEGSSNHRLIFAVTPVDDSCSNMFYSVWWPRRPGDDSETPPDDLRARIDTQFMVTIWEDLEIWRYQKYVEKPALAKQDARPYTSLRRWAKQFYEVEPTPA